MTPTGLVLILTETEAAFALSSDAQTAAEKAHQKELGKDIGDAGLEVLAIVLYRGASTRAHIDYFAASIPQAPFGISLLAASWRERGTLPMVANTSTVPPQNYSLS